MKKTAILLLSFLVLGCNSKKSKAQKPEYYDSLPQIEAVVNDFEHILSPKEEEVLTHMITDFEKRTTIEIVVVTVKKISPYDNVFDYSLDLANKTEVGKKDKRNGIFIVASNTLQKIQIQNGDGIVSSLSNEKTKTIIDQFIIPEFKKAKFYKGLNNGIGEIIKNLE